jgi:hypothetical protein
MEQHAEDISVCSKDVIAAALLMDNAGTFKSGNRRKKLFVYDILTERTF